MTVRLNRTLLVFVARPNMMFPHWLEMSRCGFLLTSTQEGDRNLTLVTFGAQSWNVACRVD